MLAIVGDSGRRPVQGIARERRGPPGRSDVAADLLCHPGMRPGGNAGYRRRRCGVLNTEVYNRIRLTCAEAVQEREGITEDEYFLIAGEGVNKE